jgi:hypothetical protein
VCCVVPISRSSQRQSAWTPSCCPLQTIEETKSLMLQFSCQQQKKSIPAKEEEEEEEAKPNTQPTVSQLKQAKSVVVARQRKSLGSHRSSEVCGIRPRYANYKQDLHGMMCLGRRERERAAKGKQSMRDANKAEHAIARQRREKERQREKCTSRVVIIASKTGTAIRSSLRQSIARPCDLYLMSMACF